MADQELMNVHDNVDEQEDDTDMPRIIATAPTHSTSTVRWMVYAAGAVIFFFLGVSFVTTNHRVIYKCLVYSLQKYIDPGLWLLRELLSRIISILIFVFIVPVQQVMKPFYGSIDMDCSPCSAVANIIEVYKSGPIDQQYRPPFVYMTDQEVVSTTKLKDCYVSNKELFDDDAPMVEVDSEHLIFPSEMFHQHESGEKRTYVWRFMVMSVAELLHQLIPMPEVVPILGQSLEQFLIVDTSQRQFKIPGTKCESSYILSLSGSRTIELKPNKKCMHVCKSLNIYLEQTYLLWYNWWYWTPVVKPASGNTTFIAHVGSYC